MIAKLCRVIAAGGVALATLLSFDTPPAEACGGFFSRAVLEGKRRPSLSYEQTLIVFDADKGHQHFVREVAFRAAHQPFGFVVPTPARPSVEKVKRSPFADLRRELAFEKSAVGQFGVGGLGLGQGFGSGRGGGVTVLEKKRVGSFTAFVLAADDEKALGAWLKKNRLVSTPEADRWLAHYVKMKFFYVALRYEPGAKPTAAGPARLESETLRISFDTPVPYYPYFEPEQPKGVEASDPRMLELWVATRKATVPVAFRGVEGGRTWVRPLQEGERYDSPRESLKRALGDDASMLPEGDLVVQTFIDQKRSRHGFGDVLFVPAAPQALSEERLHPLLPILDPSLAGGAP